MNKNNVSFGKGDDENHFMRLGEALSESLKRKKNVGGVSYVDYDDTKTEEDEEEDEEGDDVEEDEEENENIEETYNNDMVQYEDIDDSGSGLQDYEAKYFQFVDDRLDVSLNDKNVIVQKIVSDFSIMKFVHHVLDSMKIPIQMQFDDSKPLFEKSQITKGEFARAFNDLVDEHLLSKEVENAVINLLHNSLRKVIEIPVKQTLASMELNKAETLNAHFKSLTVDDDDEISLSSIDVSLSEELVVSGSREYKHNYLRWLSFDTCKRDCMVFIGTDRSKLFNCPHCNSVRFRPCSRSKCVGHGETNCLHLLKDGIAYKQFHYRLLIPMLIDLINTEYFVAALNFVSDSLQDDDSDFYTDICEGQVAIENRLEMDLNFKAWQLGNQDLRSQAIPVSLLLNNFYDAGQLFKWKTCEFWGLFTGILNLPKSFRGKIGISNFLQFIYSGKHTDAESFIFIDCYGEELRALYNGFEYTSNDGRLYFIQARLIYHSMDTKAMEPIFKIQSMANSLYGNSLSNSGVHGIYVLSKCVYMGNRHLLPLDSVLRYIGQSGKCCPKDFYNWNIKKRWFVREEYESNEESISAFGIVEKLRSKIIDKRLLRKHMDFCMPCDNNLDRQLEIQNVLLDPKKEKVFVHSDSARFRGKAILKGLLEHSFHRHFDLRPVHEVRRLTKFEHMEAAMKARELNMNRVVEPSIKVMGFFDVWWGNRLPYSDLPKHACYPPYHAIGGVIEHMLNFMLGVYKDPILRKKGSHKEKKEVDQHSNKKQKLDFSKAEEEKNYIPQYRPCFAGRKAPFSCSPEDFKKCDAWLQCILLPIGLSDRETFRLSIRHLGQLKLDEIVQIVFVFWDFIIFSLSDIEEGYKTLFRMMGADIKKLLSWRIPKDGVEHLRQEIYETVGFWELMFPAKQNYFQVQEYMDLVLSIPILGPINSLNDLCGERALGQIKRVKKMSNPGGISYEKMVMERHVNREINILRKFYSSPVNSTSKKAPNFKSKVSYDKKSNIFHCRGLCSFELYHPNKTIHEFNDYEFEFFVSLMLRELKRRFKDDEEECLKCSCLYRICNTDLVGKLGKFMSYSDRLKYIFENSEIFNDLENSLASALINFRPLQFQKASIYGVHFSSRGFDCREVSLNRDNANYGAQQKTFTARKVLEWDNKKNYSCWCLMHPFLRGLRYGRLNSFFAIDIPDESLNGLLVASVTSHKFEHFLKEGIDIVREHGSLDKETLFVALQDICPTRIATIPFVNDTTTNSLVFVDPNNQYSRYSRDSKSQRQPNSHYQMLKLDHVNLDQFPTHRPFTLYTKSNSVPKDCSADKSNLTRLQSVAVKLKTKILSRNEKIEFGEGKANSFIKVSNNASKGHLRTMLEPSICSISIQAEELPNEDFNLSHTASSSTSTAFNDEIFLSNQKSQLKRDSFLCLPHLSSQRISSIGIPIRPYNRLNAPLTSKLNSSNTFDFHSNNIHQRQVTSDSIGQIPTVDSSTDVIPRCPSSCVSDTYNPMSNTLKATNHQRIVPSTSTGQNKRLSSSFSKLSSTSSFLCPATSTRTNDRPSSLTISTVRLPTPTTAAKNNESPSSSNASFLQSNTSGVTKDRRSLSVSKPSSVLFPTSSNAMNHYCPAPSNSSFDPFATAVTQSKLSTSSSKALFLSTSRYDSRFVLPKSNTSTAAPSATTFTAANHQRPLSLSSSLLKSSLNSSFLRSSTSSTSSTSPKNLESPASSCAYSVQESKFAASNSKSHSEEDDDLPLIDFSNDQDDEAQPGLLHWAVVAEVIPVEIGSPSLRNITVTQEDRLHISNVLECADLDRVIIVKFAIDITIRKLKCLRPRTWLNDEVINFYFNMLMSGLHREEGFYSFSSFFFVRLLDPNKGGYLYQNVRRWTTTVDIFSKKKIFFPINIDNTHWTLLLIDLTVKTIFYYDSYRKVGVYASHALRVGLFIYSFYYYGYYD
jgi:hypothetical protein